MPPEFKFAYTVLKNGGYLNLDDDKKVPVPSTSDEINLPNENFCDSIKSIQEKTSNSLVCDGITSLDLKPTKHIQEKALNYNIIRDCRRGKF